MTMADDPEKPPVPSIVPPSSQPDPEPAPDPSQATPPTEMRQVAEQVVRDAAKRREPPKPARARAAPASSDELEEAVTEAQRQLAEAGGAGAFARDPYRLVLAGLSAALGVFPKLVRRTEGSVSSVVAELGRLASAVRHPLTDAERATLRREVVEAVGESARQAMPAAAVQLVQAARAKERATVAAAFAAVVVAICGVGAGAYYAGRSSARAEAIALIAAERARLEGLQDGPALPLAEATAWATLIRANPAIRQALGQARDRQTSPSGQPYGLVPLWLGLPVLPPANGR